MIVAGAAWPVRSSVDWFGTQEQQQRRQQSKKRAPRPARQVSPLTACTRHLLLHCTIAPARSSYQTAASMISMQNRLASRPVAKRASRASSVTVRASADRVKAAVASMAASAGARRRRERRQQRARSAAFRGARANGAPATASQLR